MGHDLQVHVKFLRSLGERGESSSVTPRITSLRRGGRGFFDFPVWGAAAGSRRCPVQSSSIFEILAVGHSKALPFFSNPRDCITTLILRMEKALSVDVYD